MTYAVEFEGSWNREQLPSFFQMEIYRSGEYTDALRNEIEEFKSKYNCSIPDGMALFREDGSVSIGIQELEGAFDCHEWIVGEIASPIFKDVKGLKRFMRDFYPVYANNSCGIHAHFKPTMGDYTNAIMNYTKFVKDYMLFLNYIGNHRNISNERYWYRVQGKEITYCKNGITLEDVKAQLINTHYEEPRYRQINFCFRKHGTIEARSFPVFKDSKTAIDIIDAMFNHFNMWFLQNPNKVKGKEIEI